MKALLVIDMLEDFFRQGVLRDMRDGLSRSINTLVAEARRAHVPIIWVRQEFGHDLADAFLAMRRGDIRITIAGTKGSQILSELDRGAGDHEIVKKRYSAFFGTRLDELLSTMNVTDLVVAGVNTHACIRMAAIDAYQRDLTVVIPHECVASNDPQHHEVTLEYLGHEIATVTDLESVLKEIRVS